MQQSHFDKLNKNVIGLLCKEVIKTHTIDIQLTFFPTKNLSPYIVYQNTMCVSVESKHLGITNSEKSYLEITNTERLKCLRTYDFNNAKVEHQIKDLEKFIHILKTNNTKDTIEFGSIKMRLNDFLCIRQFRVELDILKQNSPVSYKNFLNFKDNLEKEFEKIVKLLKRPPKRYVGYVPLYLREL